MSTVRPFNRSMLILGLASLAVCAGTVVAQSAQPAGGEMRRVSDNPGRDNVMRLLTGKPITIELNEGTPLSSVLEYIERETKAEFEPIWRSDKQPDGMAKDAPVSLNAKEIDPMTFLTKVLAQVGDPADPYLVVTWQLTPNGRIQIGPKAILNTFRRVELYDINQLLFETPFFTQAPEIDLDRVLQGGDGGSQGSPFRNTGNQPPRTPEQFEEDRRERATEIIGIITQHAEDKQWTSGGGPLPDPRYYEGHIIVDAPDYVHRALDGYSWLPSSQRTIPAGRSTQRFVSMNLDTSNTILTGITQIPVTAIAGGGTAGN